MHQHLHSKHQQSKFQHAIHSFKISHHCRMPHSCQIPKVFCKPTTLHHKIQTHSHCKTQIYHHYKFSLFHSRTVTQPLQNTTMASPPSTTSFTTMSPQTTLPATPRRSPRKHCTTPEASHGHMTATCKP